ncbi:MAG: alpha/beta hydrolase [Spartobacteria bacterium]
MAKNKLFWFLLAFSFGFSLSPLSAAVPVKTEVFGTASDGTTLHWDVYTPTGVGPWPAVLVIHGGNFYGGGPSSSPALTNCAQDLAAAGYIAFAIEYRLAPPGSLAGQVSAGRFPDQTNDVKLAVRAARRDSRSNQKVGAVGGSAGGYHVAFVATTGTAGDDRIDVGVSLSGAYDLSDFSANANLAGFTANVLNYVGVTVTNTTALRAASPAWLTSASTAPLFLVNTVGDPMPYVQLPDMMTHFDAAGSAKYQAETLSGSAHSFDNWSPVKAQALTFLANGFAGISPPLPLPPPNSGNASQKLLNVSSRAKIGTGDNALVGGFILTGTTDKRIVLRAIGPSLGQFGVPGVLADPLLQLFDSAGTLIESNDNRLVIPGLPNPLLPTGTAEAFLTGVFPPGGYTAVLSGVGSGTGNALFELYDLDAANSSVSNISTRGDIAASSDAVIGGFIVGGANPTGVIVRGLGPSLGAFGVSQPLPDPYLELHDSNGTLLASNDNWRSTQEQQIIATRLQPPNDKESAIVATLPPGNYTALMRDARFSTGVGLFEVYNLDLP